MMGNGKNYVATAGDKNACIVEHRSLLFIPVSGKMMVRPEVVHIAQNWYPLAEVPRA